MPGRATGGATGFRGIYTPAARRDAARAQESDVREPEGWLPRLLHSLVPQSDLLPYALRNDAGSRFVAPAYSLVLLALLGLAWFSGVTDLVPMTARP